MVTKSYCGDCPDRESCHQGTSCEIVRSANSMIKQIEAMLTGKGKPIMSNSKNITDARNAAAESGENVDKLVAEAKLSDKTTVPAQGESKDNSEKNVTDPDEKTEVKLTVKQRVASLVEKAKGQKQFFLGLVVGAVAASVTVTRLAKEKVEEAVADEDESDTPDDSAV